MHFHHHDISLVSTHNQVWQLDIPEEPLKVWRRMEVRIWKRRHRQKDLIHGHLHQFIDPVEDCIYDPRPQNIDGGLTEPSDGAITSWEAFECGDVVEQTLIL